MEHLARLPQATKIWRPFVQDTFNDAGLFNLSSGDTRQSWIRLLAAMLSSDKERILDLLGETYRSAQSRSSRFIEQEADNIAYTDRSLAVTSTANIFVSREQETLQRATTVRRVSLCLFVCPKNQYLAQLPTFQARIVELLRMSTSNSSILAEVSIIAR